MGIFVIAGDRRLSLSYGRPLRAFLGLLLAEPEGLLST